MEHLSLEFCTFCFFSYSFSTFSSCPLYSRTDLEHRFLLCLTAELKGVGGRRESGRGAAGVQINVGMITDSVWPVLYNTCGELLALPSQRVQGLLCGRNAWVQVTRLAAGKSPWGTESSHLLTGGYKSCFAVIRKMKNQHRAIQALWAFPCWAAPHPPPPSATSFDGWAH